MDGNVAKKRRKFRQCSEVWHRFLGIPSAVKATVSPRQKRKAKRLVERGRGCPDTAVETITAGRSAVGINRYRRISPGGTGARYPSDFIGKESHYRCNGHRGWEERAIYVTRLAGNRGHQYHGDAL